MIIHQHRKNSKDWIPFSEIEIWEWFEDEDRDVGFRTQDDAPGDDNVMIWTHEADPELYGGPFPYCADTNYKVRRRNISLVENYEEEESK